MMKESHTALFVAPTGVRKTNLALDLLEHEYFDHFDFIIIICTTLHHNITYRSQKWFLTYSYITLIEPGDRLYNWIKKLSNNFIGFKTLSLTGDIIANETFNKQMQPLLDLAISGRHKGHLLWLLTQSYTAVLLNIICKRSEISTDPPGRDYLSILQGDICQILKGFLDIFL